MTKYKANRSFLQLARTTASQTLEYDQVSSYTAELFDNFMDYKLLLKQLHLIMRNRESYRLAEKEGIPAPIDLSVNTLIGVRFALQDEQSKIVDAVS